MKTAVMTRGYLVVTAALVVPGGAAGRHGVRVESPAAPALGGPRGAGTGGRRGPLLSSAELDGEGAPSRVHLEDRGLPAPRRPTAVPAVDEELADLLGHRDVVHHHRQLGVAQGRFSLRSTQRAGGRRLPLPHPQARAPGRSWASWGRSAHLLKGEEGLERWWERTALQGACPSSRGLGGHSKIDLLLHAITGSPPLSLPDIPAFRAHILCAGHEHTHHPI